MAIQLRRGSSSDYDPTKMLEGEPVIFTDTDEMVFMGGTDSVRLLGNNAQSFTTAEKEQIKENLSIDGVVKNLDVAIAAGSSRTITFPALQRGMIYLLGAGAATQTGLYAVFTKSSGTTVVQDLIAGSVISHTETDNTVTFTNGRSSGDVYVLYIGTMADEVTIA